MNNNGLVECKESFITKIRKFFKKLFEKKIIITTAYKRKLMKILVHLLIMKRKTIL